MVGRLSDQKFAILMPVLERMCRLENVQIAVLGAAHPLDSHGRQYAAEVRRLAEAPENGLFFFEGFEPELSHIIYGASDMFLMPSTYEPCGLAQLISMRYGTVPVVRFAGGLADTVIDEREGTAANGFGFKEPVYDMFAMANIDYAAELLLETVERAVGVFAQSPARWGELMKNGMSKDCSWTVPARQYVKIYHEAVFRRVRSHFLSV
jgi:starch synthase